MKMEDAWVYALAVCACVLASVLVIAIHIASGELCAHHVLHFC